MVNPVKRIGMEEKKKVQGEKDEKCNLKSDHKRGK